MIELIIFWVASGILAYAMSFAFFQREFTLIAKINYRQDMTQSIFIGCFGPVVLFSVFFCTEFAKHGLKLK